MASATRVSDLAISSDATRTDARCIGAEQGCENFGVDANSNKGSTTVSVRDPSIGGGDGQQHPRIVRTAAKLEAPHVSFTYSEFGNAFRGVISFVGKNRASSLAWSGVVGVFLVLIGASLAIAIIWALTVSRQPMCFRLVHTASSGSSWFLATLYLWGLFYASAVQGTFFDTAVGV